MITPKMEAPRRPSEYIASCSDIHQEQLTVSDSPETGLSRGNAICNDYAAVHLNTSGLARHSCSDYTEFLGQSFPCPFEGCGRKSRSEQVCREHNRSTHRFSCGEHGCGRDFSNESLLAQHKDEHTRQDSHSPAKACPHPGCGQIFPDQAALFAHYDGLHPLSVYSPGKKLPFKCPFCQKKYAMERYMLGHQRRDHSTNEGSLSEQYENQTALIRESHDSIARKASRMVKDIPIVCPVANRGTEPHIKRKEYSLSTENLAIYVDNKTDPVSPQLYEPGERSPQDRSEKMAIDYVLHSISVVEAPHATHEDYPESYALNHWEMPRETAKTFNLNSAQFSGDALGQRLIHWVLVVLDMNHWLTLSEVLELWEAFLTPAQRVIILEQLNQIDVGGDDTAIFSALHGSVLCEVIHEWAQFKLLTLQVPEELRQHSNSAKGTTWAILKYCTELETLIREGRMAAVALDLVWPVSLREAPIDESCVRSDAPFVELLAALEARVKCRAVHPIWTQFTNELVLKEMSRYFQDLKTEAEATRSLNLRTIDWFGKMNLL